MRVTIIRDDSTVAVDGVTHAVDLAGMPADVHAVQWYGQAGEVEHSVTVCDHCGARSKKPNQVISDFAPYAGYLDAWKLKAAEAVAEKAKSDAAGPKD